MPGHKRKIDEDTWLVSQSKKFKFPLSTQFHQVTLAALRLGTHNYFQKPEQLTVVVNGRQRNFSNSDSSSPACHYCWSMNRSGIEKCSFCDKNVCHLTECWKCTSSFCTACGIERHDKDSTFVCFGCM